MIANVLVYKANTWHCVHTFLLCISKSGLLVGHIDDQRKWTAVAAQKLYISINVGVFTLAEKLAQVISTAYCIQLFFYEIQYLNTKQVSFSNLSGFRFFSRHLFLTISICSDPYEEAYRAMHDVSLTECFSGCLRRFQLLLWSCYLLPGLSVPSIASSLTTQQ